MSTKRIERRLVSLGERLGALRAEADECEAQLGQLIDEADDARIRALVSDSPIDRHDRHSAQRSADTIEQRHRRVLAKIATLQAKQDALLDQLASSDR